MHCVRAICLWHSVFLNALYPIHETGDTACFLGMQKEDLFVRIPHVSAKFGHKWSDDAIQRSLHASVYDYMNLLDVVKMNNYQKNHQF